MKESKNITLHSTEKRSGRGHKWKSKKNRRGDIGKEKNQSQRGGVPPIWEKLAAGRLGRKGGLNLRKLREGFVHGGHLVQKRKWKQEPVRGKSALESGYAKK